MSPIVFDLRLRTTNPLNGGDPGNRWAAIARSRTRAEHRFVAKIKTTSALRLARKHPADVLPCVVTLTRYSAGKMDTDGLAASQKGIRDGIADALMVNDGGPAVTWVYEQAKCQQGVFGVRVRIERRELTGGAEVSTDTRKRRPVRESVNPRRPPPDEVA